MLKQTRLFAASILIALSGTSSALNILLTNDDGWNSPGITAMRTALIATGHTVTLVAPLANQSGKGGSLNVNYSQQVAVVESGGPGTGIWSAASTPSDSVRAAFGNVSGGGILPAGFKPDLVISGINNGQNIGMTGVFASGTVNAALTALIQYGVPSIAVSTERLFIQSDIDTLNAMPATADFIVRLVDRLQATSFGGQLLPTGTMLNVNYPVFNAAAGRPGTLQSPIKVTNLSTKSNLEFTWQGIPLDPAYTGTMGVFIDFNPAADSIVNSDRKGMKAGFVTVTPMDGDMTAKKSTSTVFDSMSWRLNGLTP